MAAIVLPKLIVFDLDNCYWNPEMYQLLSGSAPFVYHVDSNSCHLKRGEVVEGSMLKESGRSNENAVKTRRVDPCIRAPGGRCILSEAQF
jgi:hypothetical protein